MWRTRAVISILVEEVVGLELQETPTSSPGSDTDDPESQPLRRARRRAILMVVIDWTAILVLFLLRERSAMFLPWSTEIESIFTLGVLAVATHAGWRWANAHHLRAVERVCSELRQRREP